MDRNTTRGPQKRSLSLERCLFGDSHGQRDSWKFLLGGLSWEVPLCKGVFSSVEFLHWVHTDCNVEMSVQRHFRCGISFFAFGWKHTQTFVHNVDSEKPWKAEWEDVWGMSGEHWAQTQHRPTCLKAGRLWPSPPATPRPTHSPKGTGRHPLGLYVRLDPFIHWTNIYWASANAKPILGAGRQQQTKIGKNPYWYKFHFSSDWLNIVVLLSLIMYISTCILHIHICISLDFICEP